MVGIMEKDLMLESKLKVPHPDPQTAGSKSDSGLNLDFAISQPTRCGTLPAKRPYFLILSKYCHFLIKHSNL